MIDWVRKLFRTLLYREVEQVFGPRVVQYGGTDTSNMSINDHVEAAMSILRDNKGDVLLGSFSSFPAARSWVENNYGTTVGFTFSSVSVRRWC